MMPEPDSPSSEPSSPRRALTQAGADAGLAIARSVASQPVMVGLIIVILVILGSVYYISKEERHSNTKALNMLLDRCLPVLRSEEHHS